MASKAPGKPWAPGQSGNPKGRPPGAGEPARLRKAIAEHVPAIIKTMTQAALSGDVQAARLLLERALPPLKALESSAPVDLSPAGTLAEQGRAVVAAVAAGAMPPGQGAALMGALGTLARIDESTDLAARVAALEKRNA